MSPDSEHVPFFDGPAPAFSCDQVVQKVLASDKISKQILPLKNALRGNVRSCASGESQHCGTNGIGIACVNDTYIYIFQWSEFIVLECAIDKRVSALYCAVVCRIVLMSNWLKLCAQNQR